MRISFRLSLGGSLGRYVLLDDLLIVLVLAALGLALARLLRRSRAETAGWGVRHDSFLIAYVMAFFFVYAASPWSRGKGDSAEPAKYLMYTYPAFVLLGARHFRSLATWLRAVVLASMAGAAVLTYTLVSFPLDPSRTVQSTIDFLLFRGLTRVYAEYNLAWPLMAYSGERIVAANLDGQPYRPWAEAVWGASRVALVHDVGYGVADLVRRELNREGARFDTWRAGSVVVFYDFDRDPRPIVARATGRDPTTEEWVAPDPDRYLASRDCIRDPPWREDPPGSRESPATGKNR